LYFDPLVVDAAWLEAETRDIAARLEPRPGPPGAVVEVPVCYGGELGPDLAAVAQFGACSEEDVITMHADVTYRVYMLGFVPGFAYMGSVDDRIAAPRRATPRTVVPPGSVAIAGRQTGVYPIATPGGWNIIGRTPMKLFDPNRQQPSCFRAGDSVRFKPITRREFDTLH
jgi:inhibitor of KinA